MRSLSLVDANLICLARPPQSPVPFAGAWENKPPSLRASVVFGRAPVCGSRLTERREARGDVAVQQSQDRVLLAAALILGYAAIIGFTDNFVRVIAAEAGLWQFHATRSAMAMAMLGLAAPVLGLRLRPVRWRGVAGRSLLHGLAMLIYFGALAFLPVAIVAAGLFTAPIFVLLISRLVYGQPVSWLQIVAVAIGFLGVILVLGPRAMAGASFAALLPVLAGVMYAMGNVATRAWCAGESAETLLAGFFVALGLLGALGMVVLAVYPLPLTTGAEGFLQRGQVWPSTTFLFWTFVQAAGSMVAVGMMIRAYQMTDAARASVLEYAILPASALWGWVLWGQVLEPVAILGMSMIAAAGVLILRRNAAEAAVA
jgi:drug/metabolite transporter (DMT)-like permease